MPCSRTQAGLEFEGKISQDCDVGPVAQNGCWTRKLVTRPESKYEEKKSSTQCHGNVLMDTTSINIQQN